MAIRKDAVLKRYEEGGYLLSLPDGSEFEADTQLEAFQFARGEGITRVYSAVKKDRFVLLARED